MRVDRRTIAARRVHQPEDAACSPSAWLLRCATECRCRWCCDTWYRSGVRRFAILFGLCLALGVAVPFAHAEPPHPHEHEIIYTRPSGFWTSNRPAVGGAYRWRLLGIGVVILAITGYGMLRLVKRANTERAARR